MKAKRLTYATLVEDARNAGLAVTRRGYGRYEIDAGAVGVTVYLGNSSWAFRRCDATRIPTPRLRLQAAYAYLGLAQAGENAA
jgi:hypothetical protein